jgi:hypothetical protein
MSVNRSILKKSRHLGFDVFIVHSSMIGPQDYIPGVLGNKCAGQHNLENQHFKETIVSGNF